MRSKFLPYNPILKKYASKLRKRGTLAEVALWLNLKKGQMLGFDFHRQKPIGNFIVDFYCPRLGLIIEIDGYSHEEKWKADENRQDELEKLGLFFLRFTDEQVKKNMEGVLEVIESWIRKNAE